MISAGHPAVAAGGTPRCRTQPAGAAWTRYAERAHTGLHGLDDARYLSDVQQADPLLYRLVAHHSCAVIEAEERGLAHVLTRGFTRPAQPLADALTFCDMTTSPDGSTSRCTTG